MPVHFGMPTLLECVSLEMNMQLCTQLGLDFVELNMNLPEYQTQRFNVRYVSELCAKYGNYVTIHMEEDFNPCDFNRAVADAYLNTAVSTIALAKAINAPVINIHMAQGVYFSLPNKRIYLFEQYKEVYLQGLLRFRKAAAQAIGSGILICIENCGAYQSFQREGIELLLESPHFALTYDIGHDYTAAMANEAFILNKSDRLKHTR